MLRLTSISQYKNDAGRLFQRGLALDAAGDIEQALTCMVTAAGQGHGEAQLQLAVWLLTGHTVAPNAHQAYALIRSLADTGDPFAMGLCASLTAAGQGTSKRWDAALQWLQAAARGGWVRGITQLGILLGNHRPEGQKLLALAGRAGDPALAAADRGADPSAENADAIGHEPPDWDAISQALKGWTMPPLPTAQWHQSAINLRVFRAMFDPSLCRYLCRIAAPYLKPARVNDGAAGDQQDASRNNHAMGFYPLEADVVTHLVRHRLARAAGTGTANAEVLSVLHYQPGQRYQPHYDFFDPDFPAHQPALNQRGQRVTTALLYLNDGYENGSTFFPRLNLRFKGQTGDVLVFDNVNARGEPDRDTLHEGEPTTAGDKWLASLWLREHPGV